MQKKCVISFVLVVLAFGLAGCAAKHQPINGVTAPTTTLEQINSDNAQLAVHNRAIAQSIMAINQAGFLEAGYFDKLSAAQIQATRIHEQLTPLLANPTAANASAIQALLTQLNAVADELIANGSAGVKDATSKQTVTNEANAIKSLASTIVSALQAAGVIK